MSEKKNKKKPRIVVKKIYVQQSASPKFNTAFKMGTKNK